MNLITRLRIEIRRISNEELLKLAEIIDKESQRRTKEEDLNEAIDI